MSRFAGIAPNSCELIGNTPLVRLNRIPGRDCAEVLAKHEGLNPGGSVKDRIGRAMIEDAEARGVLGPGTVSLPGSMRSQAPTGYHVVYRKTQNPTV